MASTWLHRANLHITHQLFIYPVKSILPTEVSIAEVTSEGFRFDRQYVLIKDPQDHSARLVEHLTIKTTFQLALFQPSIDDDWSKLTIKHTLARPESSITIPLTPSPLSCLQAKSYRVSIFGTEAPGIDMGEGPADFFSKHLGMPVRLLFISGSGRRDIPGAAFIPKQRITSLTIQTGDSLQPQRIRFADAAPFLVTTTASEEEVRSRLPEANRQEDVIIRLRPNIHIDVGSSSAWDEDNWREITVLSENPNVPKAIIRCVFTTARCLSLNVDLKTGEPAPRDQQLYGLLAKDRRVNKSFPLEDKPVFGQYAFAAPNGATLRVGDEIRITQRVADRPVRSQQLPRIERSHNITALASPESALCQEGAINSSNGVTGTAR